MQILISNKWKRKWIHTRNARKSVWICMAACSSFAFCSIWAAVWTLSMLVGEGSVFELDWILTSSVDGAVLWANSCPRTTLSMSMECFPRCQNRPAATVFCTTSQGIQLTHQNKENRQIVDSEIHFNILVSIYASYTISRFDVLVNPFWINLYNYREKKIYFSIDWAIDRFGMNSIKLSLHNH